MICLFVEVFLICVGEVLGGEEVLGGGEEVLGGGEGVFVGGGVT